MGIDDGTVITTTVGGVSVAAQNGSIHIPGRADHRHDAGFQGFWQCRPDVDQVGKVGLNGDQFCDRILVRGARGSASGLTSLF